MVSGDGMEGWSRGRGKGRRNTPPFNFKSSKQGGHKCECHLSQDTRGVMKEGRGFTSPVRQPAIPALPLAPANWSRIPGHLCVPLCKPQGVPLSQLQRLTASNRPLTCSGNMVPSPVDIVTLHYTCNTTSRGGGWRKGEEVMA